jgi:hypothetical protein
MKLFLKSCCLFWILGLGACAKPIDLDAPCPDYGRYCPQAPVNAWDNEEPLNAIDY